MRQSRGAVALEFLFLFPFVVGILYAAASYGIVFFSKYEMQNVVDQAVQAALRVDRNRFPEDEIESRVTAAASSALEQGWALLPASLQAGVQDVDCSVLSSGGVDLLRCAVTRDNVDQPILPQVSFGFLGSFPPMPTQMSAAATVAF
jgi:Flp pilus assembly protein TadG